MVSPSRYVSVPSPLLLAVAFLCFITQHEAHAMVQLTGGSHFSALDHTISVGQGLYGHAQLDCMPIDPRARLVHDLQN